MNALINLIIHVIQTLCVKILKVALYVSVILDTLAMALIAVRYIINCYPLNENDFS